MELTQSLVDTIYLEAGRDADKAYQIFEDMFGEEDDDFDYEFGQLLEEAIMEFGENQDRYDPEGKFGSGPDFLG